MQAVQVAWMTQVRYEYKTLAGESLRKGSLSKTTKRLWDNSDIRWP